MARRTGGPSGDDPAGGEAYLPGRARRGENGRGIGMAGSGENGEIRRRRGVVSRRAGRPTIVGTETDYVADEARAFVAYHADVAVDDGDEEAAQWWDREMIERPRRLEIDPAVWSDAVDAAIAIAKVRMLPK